MALFWEVVKLWPEAWLAEVGCFGEGFECDISFWFLPSPLSDQPLLLGGWVLLAVQATVACTPVWLPQPKISLPPLEFLLPGILPQ